MPSTAISAQGTIIQIATGTGTAKNLTAVAVGNPTILTSASHGFSNGDLVAIASLTGANAGTLNGQNWTVLYKTTNTFAVGADTTGMTITGTGTATPQSYTTIANVREIREFESGAASEIDVTNLSSTAKEKRLGLVDNGGFSLTLDHSNADAGQAALQARRLDGAAVSMKVVLPSGTTPTASFSGYVKKFAKTMAVDGVAQGSVDVTISGAITWS